MVGDAKIVEEISLLQGGKVFEGGKVFGVCGRSPDAEMARNGKLNVQCTVSKS